VARRDLSDASVLITGAAGGLGRALTARFAATGARVSLLDIDGERLEMAAAPYSDVTSIVCDITDSVACRNAISKVLDTHGRIDVLINNAGMTHRSAFRDTDPAVIARVMEVNYLGSVNMTSAALPRLIERAGAIAVVSSVAGFAPVLGRAGYVGAKHALGGLFSTLRAELRPLGVDVTIIAPTFIDTDMQTRALGGDGNVTDHPQSRVGRQVDPGTVADKVYRGIERRRRFVVIGGVGHVARVMTAVAPGIYESMMARSLRSELDR
jgi:NAD(P)-dependent dehydrogenase (short-subunit alcohol dehydrogenase family)